MQGITILGSTGSIGQSTLDVIARNSDRFKVVALAAQKNVKILFQQCQQFNPEYAVLSDHNAAEELKSQIKINGLKTQVLSGSEGLKEVASLPQVALVMAAIVGAVGLLPILAAVRTGKKILLANKEALVMAGNLFIHEVKKYRAQLLPIDSEHNAIFQCLPSSFSTGDKPHGVTKIILTASGGAFRKLPLEDLANVTPEQATTHPNWSMGRKITVDSATMMNKGLEVIEAHWLFGLPAEQIHTILHPQSVIHSLVEYLDGSVLAQLGNPDMRTPIAQALAWPERISSGVMSLDLLTQNCLNFEPMDLKRYPCLALAYNALHSQGTAPAILNAANEVAVEAFLKNRLAFSEIYTIIAKVLEKLPAQTADNLEVILEDDLRARELATSLL